MDTIINNIDKQKDIIEYLYSNRIKIIEHVNLVNKIEVFQKELKLDKTNSITHLKSLITMKLFEQKHNSIPDKLHNKEYYTILVNNAEKHKLFYFYNLLYAMDAKIYKNKKYKLCVGFDFEFNNRKIALMQLNYERKYHNFIFIVNPEEFSSENKNMFIDYILSNINVAKILHGSDSLDIPYIYVELLEMKKDKILNFTNTMVDTRFSCEFNKNIVKQPPKCSIYDALFSYNVIDQPTYNMLNKIHHDMGPPQDIHWDIHLLSKSQVLYALYDVFYLKYFYKTLYEINKNEEMFQYLNQVNRFIYLEKREVTNLTTKCKQEIDPINNYFVLKNDKQITLVTIYNETMQKIKFPVDHLISINYFRTQLGILFKKLVYTQILKKHKVYKDKKTPYKIKLSNEYLIKELKEIKLNKIIKLIEKFNHEIGKLI